MFVSSYIPLYLLLIAKDIVGRLEHYGLKSLKNFYKINSLNDIMILILLCQFPPCYKFHTQTDEVLD